MIRTVSPALLLLLLSIPISQAGSIPPSPLSPVEREAINRAHALIAAGQAERGYAIYDSLLDLSVRRGDPVLRIAALTAKGGDLSYAGTSKEAEPLLAEALRLAEARREWALYCRAAIWRVNNLLEMGRLDDFRGFAAHSIPISIRVGDQECEGFLRKGEAYVELQQGHPTEALRGYEEARSLFRDTPDRFGEIDAVTGMGRAYDQIGNLDLAQKAYEEVLDLARRYGMKENEANALNNLATNGLLRGDPAAAIVRLRAALLIHRSLGNVRGSLVPAANAARALTDLGRYGEADALLDSLMQVCRSRGNTSDEALVMQTIAELRMQQGDREGAIRLERDIMDLPDPLPVDRRSDAMLGCASALLQVDSAQAAFDLMMAPMARIRDRIAADDAMGRELILAGCLLRMGRTGEAMDHALRADRQAESLNRANEAMDALTLAARAAIRLGLPTEARRDLDGCVRLWEIARARPSDPEWRERREEQTFLPTLVGFLLEEPASLPRADRVRAAFDAAQRFKSRTLLERMGARLEGVTLEQLQSEVLRDHEVLIDFLVGDERSYVFTVSQHDCSVSVLPGSSELYDRIGVYHDLLSLPERNASDTIRLGGTAIGILLLGSVAEKLREADRIFYVPDGPVYRMPLDVVRLPGSREWLGLEKVISRIPSAAYLALCRSRQGEPRTAGAFRGLALAGGETGAKPRLPGARAEVRRLGRYAGMDLELPVVDSTQAAMVKAMEDYDLLHFAAHTELDDQHPWRSAVILHASGANGAAPWPLRAEEIAPLPLRASMVAISGCESAGGNVIEGEGLQGLTTAFLAAGARVVVGTLWPVEDRTTCALMSSFYTDLSRGMPAGLALQAARRDLARSRGTSSPFYWAGVLLIGDPEVRIDLHRKDQAVRIGLASMAVVAVAIIFIMFARTRVIPSSRERPR